MAQNNQGWRESHRYQNRQDQYRNDQWNRDDHREQNDWQQRQHNGPDSIFHEEHYPGPQRYQSEWGSQQQDDNYQQRDRGYNSRYEDQRNDRRNDRSQDQQGQNHPSYNWGENSGRHDDQQGYRNPAGGSAERYGSTGYDRNNRNESNWNDQASYGQDRYNGNQWNSRDNNNNNGQHSGKGPKGYRRSDERIQDDIHDKLTYNGDLDASAIEVEVSEGEVTLSGTVDSRSNKRLAEDLAEGVSGVQNVENRLRVQQEDAGSDNKNHGTQKNKRMSAEGTTQDHADRKTTKTV